MGRITRIIALLLDVSQIKLRLYCQYCYNKYARLLQCATHSGPPRRKPGLVGAVLRHRPGTGCCAAAHNGARRRGA